MHTEQLSAADAVGAADHTQSGPEHRARTTIIAILAAAQNGTSGVLAYGKHASRGGLGHAANHSCGAPCPIGDLVFPT